MPSLYNPLSIPLGLRLCYWHPDYVSECQSFCIVRKLTDRENRILCADEEIHLFVRPETVKYEAHDAADRLLDDQGGEAEYLTIDGQSVRVIYAKNAKNPYFFGLSRNAGKVPEGFGLCNTQTNGGVPPKTLINRSDFLAR